ncbi:hypothetical protein FISHEDRAFT_59715 [Fistulina hepatica ATCC 64428]|uniref:Uncharacterized protein n=1 Tax=Fistulina hepatica ATCC 64428 TaxID=1128425 RepID=A0A0D7A9E4_9AGAR|nr:hypothetical protein FISHEDRAFT_59715 [Fistulina hepatica ATCC 64428]
MSQTRKTTSLQPHEQPDVEEESTYSWYPYRLEVMKTRTYWHSPVHSHGNRQLYKHLTSLRAERGELFQTRLWRSMRHTDQSRQSSPFDGSDGIDACLSRAALRVQRTFILASLRSGIHAILQLIQRESDAHLLAARVIWEKEAAASLQEQETRLLSQVVQRDGELDIARRREKELFSTVERLTRNGNALSIVARELCRRATSEEEYRHTEEVEALFEDFRQTQTIANERAEKIALLERQLEVLSFYCCLPKSWRPRSNRSNG